MLTTITENTIRKIKHQVAQLNTKLVGESLYVYESDTEHCVVALVNQSTLQITASFGFDVTKLRDLCLLKHFLRFLMLQRVEAPHAIAA